MNEITFTKKVNIGSEAKPMQVELEYTVGWSKSEERGWFEVADVNSGGLRFYQEGELLFDGKELIDYDGVYELDENIIKTLKKWGAKDEL